MSGQALWHGGDLGVAQRLYPDAPRPFLDLSTGINPVAYPVPPLAAASFERLPAPHELRALEAAAAEAYGIGSQEGVVATPGTQAVIALLPRLRPPGSVAILGPTYAEHAHAWHVAEHKVRQVKDLSEAGEADVVVVVNPNNPDGRRIARGALLALGADLGRRGGWLVVDEAFADFDDEESVVAPLAEGLVVLRSFGKTYGLAGLRLGFVVTSPGFAGRVRQGFGPWAVSGPAIAVGAIALRDAGWRHAARLLRRGDAARLDAILHRATGAQPCGTSLFRLIETPQARRLFDHLGRRGIWTRAFQDRPDRLRLGLPGNDAGWARLDAACRSFAGCT